MELPTYLSRRAVAKTLNIDSDRVHLVLGPADVEIAAVGQDDWPAWSIKRVLAFAYEGKRWMPIMPDGLTQRLYGLSCAADRCNSQRHAVRPLMGEPEAIFQGPKGEWPLYTGKSVMAAMELVKEARAAGSTEFDRKRSREVLVAARQRNRAERVRAAQLKRRDRLEAVKRVPQPRGRICQALHRDADNIGYQRRSWR
jgi:hypothetical protein